MAHERLHYDARRRKTKSRALKKKWSKIEEENSKGSKTYEKLFRDCGVASKLLLYVTSKPVIVLQLTKSVMGSPI